MKVFVTATGTELGKTYVACGLLRQLRQDGCQAVGLKPVMSGYDAADQGHDAAKLLLAHGLPISEQSIAAIAPWRFRAPVSPDWAAALEGRVIDYPQLVAFCQRASEGPESVVIEGIGGLMVPLCPSRTVLDLMADLALPVVLVVGTYLGTLSHSLSALAVLAQRGLRCIVVVSPTDGCKLDPAITARTIQCHGAVPVIVLARTRPPLHDPAFAQIVQAVGSLAATAPSDGLP